MPEDHESVVPTDLAAQVVARIQGTTISWDAAVWALAEAAV
jgi:hypothetical protein